MSLCRQIPCKCGRCKLLTCGCGKQIFYEESACSPECYTKIESPKIELAPVFDICGMLRVDFELNKIHQPEEQFIETLWKWLSPNQQDGVLKELRELGEQWRSE